MYGKIRRPDLSRQALDIEGRQASLDSSASRCATLPWNARAASTAPHPVRVDQAVGATPRSPAECHPPSQALEPAGLRFPKSLLGVALKAKRCSRLVSKRSSVFEPPSLSLSMMSWIIPQ
jgi:hypothetical protein